MASASGGGACTQGCGCQAWHKPEDDPSSRLCDGCQHHLCFHSLGADTCKWQLVKRDDNGEPILDSSGNEVVSKRCRCSKWFQGEKRMCEGCEHHISYHVAVPRAMTAPPIQARPAPATSDVHCVSSAHGVGVTSSNTPTPPPSGSGSGSQSQTLSKDSKASVRRPGSKEKVNPEWVHNYASECSPSLPVLHVASCL